MSSLRIGLIVAVAVSAAIILPSANAGQVKIAYEAIVQGGVTSSSTLDDTSIGGGGSGGLMRFNLDEDVWSGETTRDLYWIPEGGDFLGFCIEIVENASKSVNTYNAVEAQFTPVDNADNSNLATMGANGQAALESLFYYGWQTDGWTATEAAAMQLAIWEISYEYAWPNAPLPGHDAITVDNLDVTAGIFKSNIVSTHAYVVAANALLTQVKNDPSNRKTVIALSYDGLQDYVTIVPLPPAFLAGLALLGGMGVSRVIRRRRRA